MTTPSTGSADDDENKRAALVARGNYSLALLALASALLALDATLVATVTAHVSILLLFSIPILVGSTVFGVRTLGMQVTVLDDLKNARTPTRLGKIKRWNLWQLITTAVSLVLLLAFAGSNYSGFVSKPAGATSTVQPTPTPSESEHDPHDHQKRHEHHHPSG